LDPERAHHLLPDIVCIYFKNKITISDDFELMAEDDSMNDEYDEDGKENHVLACHLALIKVNK
jgi:hypothetical protein